MAIRNAFAFLAVHGGLERGLDDLDRVRIVAGTFQRFDHSAGDRLPGSDRGRGPIDSLQRVDVVGHAPVPFETLRRHTGADAAAVGDPFGEAGIVAVQECGSVAVQAVNLKKADVTH